MLMDDFIDLAVDAIHKARKQALAAGQPSCTSTGMAGTLSGRRFEIHLDPTKPRESQKSVVRELTADAA